VTVKEQVVKICGKIVSKFQGTLQVKGVLSS